MEDLSELMKDRYDGLFISFEGGDGSGKSTQVELLYECLKESGLSVLKTFEPGSTEFGAILRELVQVDEAFSLPSKVEALLYAADRGYHVDKVIRPALEAGKIVLTDRYIDSSVAYQGGGRSLGSEEIRSLSGWSTDGLVPDLTFLLDLDDSKMSQRVGEEKDKIESAGEAFHSEVRESYLKMADADPRFIIVNAEQSIEEVFESVLDGLRSFLRSGGGRLISDLPLVV